MQISFRENTGKNNLTLLKVRFDDLLLSFSIVMNIISSLLILNIWKKKDLIYYLFLVIPDQDSHMDAMYVAKLIKNI